MASKEQPKKTRKKVEGVMATPGVQKVTSHRDAKGGGRHPSGVMTGSKKVKAASGGMEAGVASRTSDVSGETRRPIGRAPARRAKSFSGEIPPAKTGMRSPRGRQGSASDEMIETAAQGQRTGRARVVSGPASTESRSTRPGQGEIKMPEAAPAKGGPRRKSGR